MDIKPLGYSQLIDACLVKFISVETNRPKVAKENIKNVKKYRKPPNCVKWFSRKTNIVKKLNIVSHGFQIFTFDQLFVSLLFQRFVLIICRYVTWIHSKYVFCCFCFKNYSNLILLLNLNQIKNRIQEKSLFTNPF